VTATPDGKKRPLPTLTQIHDYVRKASNLDLPAVRFAVLRNTSVEALEIFLQYEGAQSGYRANVGFSGFGSAREDVVLGHSSLVGSDYFLVWMRLDGLSWKLTRAFCSLDRRTLDLEVDRVISEITDLIAAIRKQTSAALFLVTFETPSQPALGVTDGSEAHGQVATIAGLNTRLRSLVSSHLAVYLIDIDCLRMRIGEDRFFDHRLRHLSSAPYSSLALGAMAHEVNRLVRLLRGNVRKCLVLDCDNVLWGGVLGEQGIEGIQIGQTYPGSVYREFQQEVLNLRDRGILIALCSKNEVDDVLNVLRSHPDMLLREHHVAAMAISWNDKATGLRQIARDLNIGLDSLVLADDSAFETGLVRDLVPEVAVLHLPVETAILNRDTLLSCGLFDTLKVTDEDRKRASGYADEAMRKQAATSAPTLQSYLSSLGSVLRVTEASAIDVPRIAQLTQKTNQFNLTTRRATPQEIRDIVSSPSWIAVTARLRDSFGDLGLIGFCAIRREENLGTIEFLMLSCRALGREVERAFLRETLTRARAAGLSRVRATYRPTSRNRQTESFYDSEGFVFEEPRADGTQDKLYSLDLTQPPASVPTHIEVER
jgi:FkbH-like protein